MERKLGVTVFFDVAIFHGERAVGWMDGSIYFLFTGDYLDNGEIWALLVVLMVNVACMDLLLGLPTLLLLRWLMLGFLACGGGKGYNIEDVR